jgi:4-amino-4-deoxy-L-arabinose transferase-like glycosyltransferase
VNAPKTGLHSADALASAEAAAWRARYGVATFGVGLILSFAAVALASWWMGAFDQEFYSDATGHYITGLALHDLVFGRGLRNPLAFLIEYFVHYPAIGLGHWPPVFHSIEAVWIALFGASKLSIVLLLVFFSAVTAATLLFVSASRWGLFAGLLGAVMFIVSPVILATYCTILIDVPVALWCLLAALAFLKYVESGRWAWSMLFAFLAATAILTKGNAMLLALFPPLVLLLACRFDLLKRPSLWAAAVVVGLLVLPWYVLTYSWTAKGFLFEWGLQYSWLALTDNLHTLFRTLGLGGLALFVLGAVTGWRDPRHALLVRGCLALALSCFLFQAIVPTALEGRYMIPALAPMLVLAAAGAAYLCRRWPRSAIAMPAIVALGILPLAPGIARVLPNQLWGLDPVVDATIAELAPQNPVVLAAVGPLTEAAVLAEVAQRDKQRPSTVVIRGSRLLGGGGFMKRDYVPRYNNIADVLNVIQRYKIPIVLLEVSADAERWEHNEQVRHLCEDYPGLFQLVSRVRNRRGGEFWVIRVRENADAKADWDALRALGRPKRTLPGG